MCSCRFRPACCRKMIWSTPAASEERTWAAEVVGRADAGRRWNAPASACGAGDASRRARRVALRLELLPQPRAAGHGVVGDERGDGVAEELEALLPAADGLGRVVVQREGRHHGDVGVDAVAERHALVALDDVVVDLGSRCAPPPRSRKEKASAPSAVARGDLDGVAVGAGHPHRRMRLLHGLGDDVAAGHRERAGPRSPDRASITIMLAICSAASSAMARFSLAGMLKPPSSSRVAPSPMPNSSAAVGDEVEHGEALGRARGMVVVGDHLADAVAEPDALGARGGGGEEHLGRRAVRVLLEEVVLDRPGVVEPEPVGELDLVQRVLHQLALVAGVPRAWAAAARRRCRISFRRAPHAAVIDARRRRRA